MIRPPRPPRVPPLARGRLGTRGFTMIELLVATFLSVLVIVALASVFGTALKFEVQGYQKDVIQAGTVLSFNKMAQDIGASTSFNADSAGAPCSSGSCSSGNIDMDSLIGCTGFDGVPGSSAFPMKQIDPAVSPTVYMYCVDSSNSLWYMSGNSTNFASGSSAKCPVPPGGTPPATGSPSYCGTGGQYNGATWQKLATNVSHDNAGGYSGFFRRPGVSNVIELHYVIGAQYGAADTLTVKTGTAAVTINEAIRANKPVNSLSP